MEEKKKKNKYFCVRVHSKMEIDIEAQLDTARILMDMRCPEKANRDAHAVEQTRRFRELRTLVGFTAKPTPNHKHTVEECEFVVRHYQHQCTDGVCDESRDVHTPPHQCVRWNFTMASGCVTNTMEISHSAAMYGCLKSGDIHHCESDMKLCPTYEDHEFNVICLYSGFVLGKADQRTLNRFSYAKSTSSGNGGGVSPNSADSITDPAERLPTLHNNNNNTETETTKAKRRVIKTLAPSNHAKTERLRCDLVRVQEILRLLFDQSQHMSRDILRRSVIELCVNTRPEIVAVNLEIARYHKLYQRNRSYYVERYARACMSLWQALSLIRPGGGGSGSAHLLSSATMLSFVLGFIYLFKSGFSDKFRDSTLSARDPFLSANLPPEMKFRTKNRSSAGVGGAVNNRQRMRTNSTSSSSSGTGVNSRKRSVAARRHGKESSRWLSDEYLIDNHRDASFLETQLRASQTKRKRTSTPSKKKKPSTSDSRSTIPYAKSDITNGKTVVQRAINYIEDQELRSRIFKNLCDEAPRT